MTKESGALSKLNSMIAKLFGMYKKPNSIEGFKQLCSKMKDDKIISQNHLNRITKVLDLESTRVKDIMIPRPNMVNVHIESSIEDIKNLVKESGHSRFPVIDEENKKILGVIVVKDLLMSKGKKSIKEFIRKILFIPENRRLNSLLNDFQKKHQHIAIVIDEYGDISGLITIENIIEQIMGDIEDEHDLKTEEEKIKKRSKNEYIIQARTSIDEFNEFFKSQFKDEDLDTIGGLILKKFGYIPKIGEQTKLDNYTFTILKASEKQIILMSLEVQIIRESKK
ncbi:MAG: transporter associated domain-containing protein [Pseudomonadota bacterium]|nr:transporter associated domain-containing protein [Pseudomonadota bacterium]